MPARVSRGCYLDRAIPCQSVSMATSRPQCPQCASPSPAVVEFGLFALADSKVDELLASGWGSPQNFVWQCSTCKHEWAV